jgi:hypothetical protein
MTASVPESRKCRLVSEHEHKTHDYRERWDLGPGQCPVTRLQGDTHDTTGKIEVTVYMLIDIDNKCCKNRMDEDGKENCFRRSLG